MAISTLFHWDKNYKKPFIVSGPCSAESYEQVISTARQLDALQNVSVFRAGIWKPRTRPGGFEGVGEEGLLWLKEVQQTTGLQTAVEVANPKHIELCLKHNVDVLWIGARTAVNPFSVQEIAQALKGIEIKLMIKNPVNPDVDLWTGVIERMLNIGIEKIIAVHRGFYSFEKTVFRNAPIWEIPIEIKHRFPDLPIICDPSHIAGNKELLFMIAQRALDLDMDGFMIESHYNPQIAKTDANQQITPEQLSMLLSKLVVRSQYSQNELFISNLEKLRQRIDKIDRDLLAILSERMKTVSKIGNYKKENHITVLQIERWNRILEDRLQHANQLDMNKDFIVKFLELIHNESIRIQTELLNKSNHTHDG